MKNGWIDGHTPLSSYGKENQRVWKLITHVVFPVETASEYYSRIGKVETWEED